MRDFAASVLLLSSLLGYGRHEVLANGIISDDAMAVMATVWVRALECILVRPSGLRIYTGRE